MEEKRVTNKVFIWDEQMTGSWTRHVHTLFCYYGVDKVFLIMKRSTSVHSENLCFVGIKSLELWIYGLIQNYIHLG